MRKHFKLVSYVLTDSEDGTSPILYSRYYEKMIFLDTKYDSADMYYFGKHLHVLSNELLCDGNYVYSHEEPEYGIFKWTKDCPLGCLKVIVSTDKRLGLPFFTDEFLMEYCSVNGVGKLAVEYIGKYYNYRTNAWEDTNYACSDGATDLKLYDGAVNAKVVKDSYSIDEVISLLYTAINDTNVSIGLKEKPVSANDWINKNLINNTIASKNYKKVPVYYTTPDYMEFPKWLNKFLEEIDTELAESGADRELDFNPEFEYEKRYYEYIETNGYHDQHDRDRHDYLNSPKDKSD